LLEQPVRVGLLEVAETYLAGRYVRGEREHGGSQRARPPGAVARSAAVAVRVTAAASANETVLRVRLIIPTP
ncbi:hypothetical protein, partial [Streptomyces sp. NPDC004230]